MNSSSIRPSFKKKVYIISHRNSRIWLTRSIISDHLILFRWFYHSNKGRESFVMANKLSNMTFLQWNFCYLYQQRKGFAAALPSEEELQIILLFSVFKRQGDNNSNNDNNKWLVTLSWTIRWCPDAITKFNFKPALIHWGTQIAPVNDMSIIRSSSYVAITMSTISSLFSHVDTSKADI